MSETIVKKKIPLVQESDIQKIIELLKIDYKDIVREAYLFGSFATGRKHFDSDLDLIIISNTTQDFVKRPLLFEKIIDMNIPLDLLVYTSEEFEKIRKEKKIGFWKSAFSQLKKIA